MSSQPKSSTPKAKPKSTVYVSHVTPSPPTSTSNGNQNGCLSSSGSYEEGKTKVNGSANGVIGSSSLENSCSSQETQEVEVNQKTVSSGDSGGPAGREKESASNSTEVMEDGVKKDGGAVVKDEGASGGNMEGSVPKITTISASPQITSSRANQQRPALGHTRASSTSSVGSPSSAEQGSSSSSSLLSHDSSFASREAIIEQLKSELQVSNLSGPDTQTQSLAAQRDTNELITQLLEHIVTLKMDLETLKEENRRLKSTRSEMDDELHTLTENLFEEAYKMVDEAKGNKVVAEKKLADAAGKIEAMETEMFALKSLIQNPEGIDSSLSDASVDRLHPVSHHKPHKRPSVRKALKKITKKATGGRLGGGSSSKTAAKQLPPPGKVVPITLVEHKGGVVRGGVLKGGELLPSDFAEFSEWLGALSSQPGHAYLDRIVQTDLVPCLAFNNDKLSAQVFEAVKDNNLIMESVTNCELGTCALSGDKVVCTHRFKLGDSDQWCHISQPCRDRIVAACDFYMCIGHIQKGIIKSDSTELYWRMSRLRAMMSLSRLNLHFPEED